MESNKDEATHCLDIAEKCIQQKNFGRGIKFLNKSLTLYPSEKAQSLLNSIQDLPYQKDCRPSLELRKKISPKCRTRSHTPDELDEIIIQILNSHNYYDILKLDKDATDKEIKKSYKQLALILHPDKTQQPGAAEAFKSIRNAASILTDGAKRRVYDIYGPEEVNNSSASYSFRSTFSKHDSETSVNCSEHNIFEEDNGGLYDKPKKREKLSLRLIWPIIFAITLTIVTTFFMHDPLYSFQKSPKYPVLRYTHNLKIPYFVKENFLMENSGMTISLLDNEVEIETITNLQHACYNERSYRNYLLQLARKRQNSEDLSGLLQMRSPSCENLREIQRVFYLLELE
ncbi:dnaJ homolog subfamily B member 14-like [Harmonia axyridis]|uniref:dnaJ homolog subfamily B member 14-like n=1 Tax=Harmonia axyridis TaxID=115357 RepID=UPI001E275CD9|nr:dnaJ homolog subfamily B member 14-like [Harmonia axyridis]